MTRRAPYADPHHCPDCATALPPGSTACPACGLPLEHALGRELLLTLTRADQLLDQLRRVAIAPRPTPAAAAVGVVGPMPVAGRSTPSPRRTGLRPTSVPAVLLGLGALCLLVAAVIFLAVAWSWLGVGGRTGVLVTLTGVIAGAGALLARRGLRVAGEALSTVALGLLALDVLGAVSAGWLGDVDGVRTTLVLGTVVLTAALGWSLAQPALRAPQLVVGVALLTAWAAAAELSEGSVLVESLAVLAALGVTALGLVSRATTLRVTGTVVGLLTWTALLLHGLGTVLADPRLAALWSADGTGWRLVAAAGLAVLPLLLAQQHELRVAAVTVAATTAVLAVVGPVVDEGATLVGVVALVVVTAGTAVAVVLPRRWAAVPLAPAIGAALPLGSVVLALATDAGRAVLDVGAPFSVGVGASTPVHAGTPHVGLLVPGTLALLALGLCAIGHRGSRLPLTVPAVLVALSLAGTLALTPGLLWLVVLALVVVGLATAALGVLRSDHLGLLLAVSVLGAATAAALPSATLTAGVTTVVALGAVALLVRSDEPAGSVAGAVLPLALAGAVWSTAHGMGVEVAGRGLPVLVALGLVVLARPRSEVEVPAAVTAVLASAAAVAAATDVSVSLALHLTVAGALVVATSLLHESRRAAAWPGGALLAAATWVRLADLGVTAPEAYTLPTAVVLVLLALHRLRLDPDAASHVLVPGLTLATVPSLLWVLADPVSARAVLLGGACLALVLLGTRLRWSAPLQVGAVVGSVLVLRELAPYLAQTPQWVLIGLAGTLLTVVGVTWEQRLSEVRAAAGALERLR